MGFSCRTLYMYGVAVSRVFNYYNQYDLALHNEYTVYEYMVANYTKLT